jgi:arginine decarboxylase
MTDLEQPAADPGRQPSPAGLEQQPPGHGDRAEPPAGPDRSQPPAGPDRSQQPTAPYLDAVVSYGFRGPARFHVPGHKVTGVDPGLLHAIGEDALALDIPQDIEGIDIGPRPTPYERAEALAAAAYGAESCFFLTNGASQGNHALALTLAPLGAHVVVQRNSHASLVDGLVLSGGRPVFVAPEYDPDLGMAHGVTPAALAAALERSDVAPRAAFIVSPTYYGMAADVAGCIEVAHAHGVPLIVDSAWGAHFGFHAGLPDSPLAQGADAMLASTHKIVGSLTQSAMLLVSGSGRVDAGAVARAVRLVRSTSPSALLMASLDAARRQLAVHGEMLLDRTIAAAALVRERVEAIPGCRVVGAEQVGRPGVAGWDPLRVVIDVRGTGHSGYEIAEALRANYDIHLELSTHQAVVLVLGLAQPLEPLERFAHDLAETVRRIPPVPAGVTAVTVPAPPLGAGDTVIAPREAFLGESEAVLVDAAVGRTSTESIAGYPPGIPTLLPGERVTSEVVDYLRALTAAGARLHGAADPSFQTLRVLVDD